MKPNQNQQLQLQECLGKYLQYRETYAEFYDHIITALEAKPADAQFEETSKQIINDDFGGIEGMRRIENKYQSSIFVEMRNRYFHYLLENLKLPWVLLFVMGALLIYELTSQPWFTFLDFFILFTVIQVIPRLLQVAVRFKAKHLYGEPRTSIKKGFIWWMNRIPATIAVAWFLFLAPHRYSNIVVTEHVNDYATTGFIVLVMLHTLTFYQVYRGDIKTSFNLS
jgi:hypothetical protein